MFVFTYMCISYTCICVHICVNMHMCVSKKSQLVRKASARPPYTPHLPFYKQQTRETPPCFQQLKRNSL